MFRRYRSIIIFIVMVVSLSVSVAHAYWVWTPQTKKFINPKYAVKDTPKEQYDWAMGFYASKDYQRAALEFEKLVKNYEYSEYASDAQYYVGKSYDGLGKYYMAFQNYQKAVDNFPHIKKMDEIIAREFEIADIYMAKDNPKVMGTDIMTSVDRAIEIYKKVVDNAPFGEIADQAQFKMAMAMKTAGRYDEATIAFQKIIDDYPASKLYEQAKYEMANSAYKASLSPAYDSAPTDKALKAFEDFAGSTKDESLTKEADTTIKRLKDKVAEKSMLTAEFYEQRKKYTSAIIYYQDVVDRFPDSISAEKARKRIEDLKAGNYAHKSQEKLAAGKKSWVPWRAGEKKPGEKPVKPSVKKLKAAQAQESAQAVAVQETEQQTVQSRTSQAAVTEEPVPTGGVQASVPASPTGAAQTVSSKKRWWAYGLSKDRNVKNPYPKADKDGKSWKPINFDKKSEGAK